MPDSSKAAKAWTEKGRAVIPIPLGRKAPGLKNWQALRLTADNIDKYFNGESQNIGVLLGEPSGGLVDVDLDTDEAVAVAPYFLPESFVYGRVNRPASHWLFEVPQASTRKWQHGGKMLVELRSTGCQSLIPPSVHPDGDVYRRDLKSKPVATLAANELIDALNRIAAATVISRHWPDTGRHDLALTLAGALSNSGWQADEIENFVEACAVAGNDEELADRRRAVQDTLKRRRKGKAATGWPRLSELLSSEVVETVREWLGIEDFPVLITSSPKSEPPALITVCAADIEPRKLEPLWDGVLWIGKPTLLVGDPGKGKSLITLDIAARVTTGKPWPCSDVEREPAAVMLLSAEDDPDDTIIPRLQAAGADLSRVHIITGIRNGKEVDWLALDKHRQELAEGMTRYEPRLLMIDPLSSYMGRADTNHEGESRKVLAKLAELAKQSRCAVLAVRHFRKGASDSAQGRVIGSVAFTAAARAVYGVADDPEDEDYRLMVCIKCNLALDTLGYRFRIAESPAGSPYVAWDAAHDYRTADELLGSSSANTHEMVCKECGQDFEARRRDTRYCSQACRQQAYRQRVTDRPESVTHNKPSQNVTGDTSLQDVTGSRDCRKRNKTRKQPDSVTGTPESVTRNKPSQTVTRDSSLRDVTRDRQGKKRNAEPQQSLSLTESKFTRPCLNCGGKGCRCCDEQLRKKHFNADD